MKKLGVLIVVLFSLLLANAQTPAPQGQPNERPRPRGGMMAGPRVMGTITEIKGNTVTVKTAEGTTATVEITSNTRIMKDRQPAKLTDFKVGDTVMAAGESKGENKYQAMFFMGGQMQMMGGRPGGGGMMGNPEDMGKKFIAGEVKAVDGVKLTILRPDNQTQIISVDDETSFKNGKGEGITLADIKVGDRVFGQGELKDGTFVPKELRVGGFQRMQPRTGEAPQKQDK